MTRQILVATDGSGHADRAVDLAAEMAAKMDGKLTIVHVLIHERAAEQWEHLAESEHLITQAGRATGQFENLPGQMTRVMHQMQTNDERERLVAAVGELILERAAKRAREGGAGQVDTRIVEGDYAEAILGTADEIGADMIVMGRRGLGTLKSLVVGSVSQKISAHAECTVVTTY